MKRKQFVFCCLLCFAVSVEAASQSKSKLKIDPQEQGQVVKKDMPAGSYLQYIPARPSDPPRLMVLVHGQLGEKDDALTWADQFIRRWIPFAEEKGLILIAPGFDQANFGGNDGPRGGYRGLFGRHIGADEFLHQIIDQYKSLSDRFDGRFYLFGKSAGGQFASRYVVLHPDRILGAVICAAGSYPYPDLTCPWADGMGALQCKMRWPGSAKDNVIDVKPDPNGWVKAAGLPITVVVGGADTDLTAVPAKGNGSQKGANRLERAKSWFQDMKDFSAKHHQPFRMRLVIVPGAGHISGALAPAAMRAIGEAIAFNSRQPASRPAASRPASKQ